MGSRGKKSKAELAIVRPSVSPPPHSVADPPRPLGAHGMALWEKVARDYDLSDPGSVEQLAQACSSLDRAEAIREQIDAEGACVEGRAHPLLRAELDHRSFLVRTLQRLGLES